MSRQWVGLAIIVDSRSMSDRLETPLSKRRLTFCVVGSGGVGKSSLTVRYLNGHFPEVGGRVCVLYTLCHKYCMQYNWRLVILYPISLLSSQFYDPTVGEL